MRRWSEGCSKTKRKISVARSGGAGGRRVERWMCGWRLEGWREGRELSVEGRWW